ncbi:hypothetical protein [Archangium sp.]|jgi:hypothetical protein|uniref:hypothetical protein n=1 Tax=Archangium sp. TaxID=1872627 RepID=UPI002EDB4106
MYRNWKLASIPVVLGLALAACPGPEELPIGTLKVTTSTKRLDGEGQSTDVYITAVDENGQAGTGTVTVSAKAGSLAGSGQELDLPLEGGKVSTTYTCIRLPAVDSGCKGSIRIQGTWNDVVGSTSVIISPPDAGTPSGTDAGTDAGG